jgi:hypothetical protein
MAHIIALAQAAPAPQGFFGYLEANRDGIFVLLLILGALVFVIQWIAWIARKGRFSPPALPPSAQRQDLRYIFSEATVKIIDDFRHLLALVLVLIFGFALAYVLIKASPSVEGMKEGVQSVVASLGGLIGSIIGYYFGESSVVKSLDAGNNPPGSSGAPSAVQGPPTTPGDGGGAAGASTITITSAPPPPAGVIPKTPAVDAEEGDGGSQEESGVKADDFDESTEGT